MRTLLMVFMIAGMMSTVGVFAAGLGGAPTIKTIGGSGTVSVDAPTAAVSTITLNWNFTGNNVTGVDVVWKALGATTYDITVAAGGNTTSAYTTGTTVAGETRTDTLTLASTAADAITDAVVTIKEN